MQKDHPGEDGRQRFFTACRTAAANSEGKGRLSRFSSASASTAASVGCNDAWQAWLCTGCEARLGRCLCGCPALEGHLDMKIMRIYVVLGLLSAAEATTRLNSRRFTPTCNACECPPSD
eukprot:g32069.t2